MIWVIEPVGPSFPSPGKGRLHSVAQSKPSGGMLLPTRPPEVSMGLQGERHARTGQPRGVFHSLRAAGAACCFLLL